MMMLKDKRSKWPRQQTHLLLRRLVWSPILLWSFSKRVFLTCMKVTYQWRKRYSMSLKSSFLLHYHLMLLYYIKNIGFEIKKYQSFFMQVLDWLTEMKVENHIELITRPMLETMVEETQYLAVFFCKYLKIFNLQLTK